MSGKRVGEERVQFHFMISHQVLFDLDMEKRILDCIFPTPNKPIPQALGNNGKNMDLNKNVFGQDDGGSSKYMLIMGILRL